MIFLQPIEVAFIKPVDNCCSTSANHPIGSNKDEKTKCCTSNKSKSCDHHQKTKHNPSQKGCCDNKCQCSICHITITPFIYQTLFDFTTNESKPLIKKQSLTYHQTLVNNFVAGIFQPPKLV